MQLLLTLMRPCFLTIGVGFLAAVSAGFAAQQAPPPPLAPPSGTAVVRGKVIDGEGNPVPGVQVQLQRYVKTPIGWGSQGAMRTLSDDRGEYRIFKVPPGQYYLAVGNPPDAPVQTPAAGGADRLLRNYAFRLYPGVTSMEQAVPIDVRDGVELAFDLRTERQPVFRISGTALNSATGRPPDTANIRLISTTPSGEKRYDNPKRNYNRETGKFELLDVAPGEYEVELRLTGIDTEARAAGEAAWAVFPIALEPVRVVDRDIEDVALIIVRPASVSGRLRVEDMPMPTNLRIQWAPWSVSSRVPPSVTPGPQGEFRLIGLTKGEYGMQVRVPRGAYVKSIQYDGADILNEPWRFSGSVTGSASVEIVVRPRAAEVEGLVTDASARPVAGAAVVLMPDIRHRKDLYSMVLTGPDGRFAFPDRLSSGIPPGSYKLLSLPTLDRSAHYDPRFMDRFEALARRVQVVEGDKIQVDLRLIPVP